MDVNKAHLEKLASTLEIQSVRRVNSAPIKKPLNASISASSLITPRDVKKTAGSRMITPRRPESENYPSTRITVETAKAIRSVLFASVEHTFNVDWRNAIFSFQNIHSSVPYGLMIQKDGSKGIIYSVQAYMIKYLLYSEERLSRFFDKRSQLLNVGEDEREYSLIIALCDILWKVGNKERAVVCLLGLEPPPAGFTLALRKDGILEKLELYEFTQFECLLKFMKLHLKYFQKPGGHGVLLYTYSILLSNTPEKIQRDLEEGEKLLTPYDYLTPAFHNLIFTGTSSVHLFNGTVVYDEEGEALAKPLLGVQERSEVGLLYWHKDEQDDKRTEVGSMLKTPHYPVWLAHINGRATGIFFALSVDLLNNWRSENRFTLYYYTGQQNMEQAMLTIDTRTLTDEFQVHPPDFDENKEERAPPLERCVLTKWPDSEIDWHGTLPFV